MAPNELRQFDAETAVDQIGDEQWSTNISGSWNIGDVPNGGYALTSSLRAMAQSLAISGMGTDPLTLTTHFLRPALAGQAAEIETELIRPGRRSSSMMSTLTQDGKERLRVLAAFGDLEIGNEASAIDKNELTLHPVELPDPDDCHDRSELDQGIELPLLSRLDVRVDPELAEPGKSGRAEISGWIRFRDGRPVDIFALPLFADAFPPSVYGTHGEVGWVPTLELTVHVRRSPVAGWIRAHFVTSDISGDLLVEDGTLWDSDGNLVARSRQLALLLSAA